jgi:hypothetical protein
MEAASCQGMNLGFMTLIGPAFSRNSHPPFLPFFLKFLGVFVWYKAGTVLLIV